MSFQGKGRTKIADIVQVCIDDLTFEHIGDAQSERFVYRPLRRFEGIFRREEKYRRQEKRK